MIKEFSRIRIRKKLNKKISIENYSKVNMDKTHLMKFPNMMMFNFLQLITLEDDENMVCCFGKKLKSETNSG